MLLKQINSELNVGMKNFCYLHISCYLNIYVNSSYTRTLQLLVGLERIHVGKACLGSW